MAAGDKTPGRRRPLVDTEVGPRMDDVFIEEWELGDYAGPVIGYTGEHPSVFYRLPNGEVGHVSTRVHKVVEEDDGTVTIDPSILNQPSGWHGYLEHGVWREV